jgi:hypothetical protein
VSPSPANGWPADISWESLSARLLLTARLFVSLRPGFIEAKDLVQIALLRYLASPIGLGYDPERGELYNFLCGVMKKILLEEGRRQRFIEGSLDDPDFARTHSLTKERALDYERRLLLENIRRELEPDHLELLKAIERALEESTDKSRINKKIAAQRGTPVQQVVNDRKRLRRRLERLQ